jgi:hypothetical protein
VTAETTIPTEPRPEPPVFKRVLVNFIVEERDVTFFERMLNLIGQGIAAWEDGFGAGASWDGPYVLDGIEEQIIHGLASLRGDYDAGDNPHAVAAFNLAKGYLLGAEGTEGDNA